MQVQTQMFDYSDLHAKTEQHSMPLLKPIPIYGCTYIRSCPSLLPHSQEAKPAPQAARGGAARQVAAAAASERYLAELAAASAAAPSKAGQLLGSTSPLLNSSQPLQEQIRTLRDGVSKMVLQPAAHQRILVSEHGAGPPVRVSKEELAERLAAAAGAADTAAGQLLEVCS